jgi:hypothetical protein
VLLRLAPPKNILLGLSPESWGCVESIPPPVAAKENFEWTPFFIISRSEMIKNGVHSKQLLAMPAANEGIWPFYTTPEYFFKTPILLILPRKINKIGVLKNLILPPGARKIPYALSR